MKNISNNKLFVIAIISIMLSLFGIFLSFGGGITGMAESAGEGFVNVTVITSAQITVHTKSVNFTGTLNMESKNSYESDHVDSNEDRPCDEDNHCGINITNDGNQFINITIQETENLFSGTYDANKHFLYNVTMQDPGYTTDYGNDGDCSVGYAKGLSGVGGAGHWRGVPKAVTEVAVCYLNSSNTLGGAEESQSSDTRPDAARVEFNITVPNDELPGDKATTLVFTALVSNP